MRIGLGEMLALPDDKIIENIQHLQGSASLEELVFTCAQLGRKALLSRLLNIIPSAIKFRSKGRETLLHVLGANIEMLDIARHLIMKGCDVNAKDVSGMSPLMVAAYHNNLEAIKLLLSNGANVLDKDYDGETALTWAVGRRQLAAVELLMRHGADSSIYHDQSKFRPFKGIEEVSTEEVRRLRELLCCSGCSGSPDCGGDIRP